MIITVFTPAGRSYILIGLGEADHIRSHLWDVCSDYGWKITLRLYFPQISTKGFTTYI